MLRRAAKKKNNAILSVRYALVCDSPEGAQCIVNAITLSERRVGGGSSIDLWSGAARSQIDKFADCAHKTAINYGCIRISMLAPKALRFNAPVRMLAEFGPSIVRVRKWCVARMFVPMSRGDGEFVTGHCQWARVCVCEHKFACAHVNKNAHSISTQSRLLGPAEWFIAAVGDYVSTCALVCECVSVWAR